MNTEHYPINFPVIELNSMFGKLNINPVKFYKVLYNDQLTYNYVVLYKMVYNDREATVPYYLSDGHTNGIRGDFLAPFMCITQFENDGCPISFNKKNLIYKYALCKNIDLRTINILLLNESKFETSLHKQYFMNSSIGLRSFLPRFENLLDFIITISTNVKLNNFNGVDDSNFIPLYNTKCKISDVISNSTNNLYTGIDDVTYYSKYPTKNVNHRLLNSLKSVYRTKILNYLKTIQHDLSTLENNQYKITPFQTNLKHFKNISLKDFNKELDICNITQSNQNYQSYKLISKIFYDAFKMLDFSGTKYIKKIFAEDVCKISSLQENITRWKAVCPDDKSPLSALVLDVIKLNNLIEKYDNDPYNESIYLEIYQLFKHILNYIKNLPSDEQYKSTLYDIYVYVLMQIDSFDEIFDEQEKLYIASEIKEITAKFDFV